MAMWKCSYSGTIILEEEADITVLDPPDLKIDVEPRYKDGKIKEGEDFFASCNVISSNPRTDNVAWTSLLDNFQVDPNNPLEILSITRDKAGEYMCSAENIYYDGSTGNTEEIIIIDVQYIPVVVLDESKTVKEGDAVSMICSTFITEANPAASEFQWIRNSAVEQTTEELTLDSVARSDAGLYSCWAFNYFYDGSLGKGESTTELVVQYAPVVTVPSVVARRVGETLTIECEVDSLPAPESVQWVAPGADQPLSQTSTVELVDIGKGEGGIYTCNSQNTFYDGVQGTGSATTIVQIEYGPEVSLESPLLPVTEGTKVTINCTVDSQPPPFKYEWTQIMKDGTVNELGENMEYLSFASVDRSKGGNYTCKATTKFYDNMDEEASASAKLVIH
ncbi:B-cell receptor CD22-like, partial [Saccoglossus kowalevskii]|uniref:B-cell receptor CD22-like n=1 Tax=Saccoglossus kowalevskii TaxID=10224 RepID=A0ABM0MT74_SACKO